MFELYTNCMTELIHTIMGAVLLPLMVVAILGAIMGAPVPAIGAALAEGAEIVITVFFEIVMRLSGVLWSILCFALKVACRAATALYSQHWGRK